MRVLLRTTGIGKPAQTVHSDMNGRGTILKQPRYDLSRFDRNIYC